MMFSSRSSRDKHASSTSSTTSYSNTLSIYRNAPLEGNTTMVNANSSSNNNNNDISLGAGVVVVSSSIVTNLTSQNTNEGAQMKNANTTAPAPALRGAVVLKPNEQGKSKKVHTISSLFSFGKSNSSTQIAAVGTKSIQPSREIGSESPSSRSSIRRSSSSPMQSRKKGSESTRHLYGLDNDPKESASKAMKRINSSSSSVVIIETVRTQKPASFLSRPKSVTCFKSVSLEIQSMPVEDIGTNQNQNRRRRDSSFSEDDDHHIQEEDDIDDDEEDIECEVPRQTLSSIHSSNTEVTMNTDRTLHSES